MLRNDWCISASIGTILVGAVYVAFCAIPDTKPDITNGALAIGGCYVLSMFAFIIRAFCRLPRGCALDAKPIRSGMWSALLGGLAYGTCVAIGVTLAYWYAARPAWDYTSVKYCVIAEFATIAVCGVVMIPVGFLAGLIYSLYNWRRAEP